MPEVVAPVSGPAAWELAVSARERTAAGSDPAREPAARELGPGVAAARARREAVATAAPDLAALGARALARWEQATG